MIIIYLIHNKEFRVYNFKIIKQIKKMLNNKKRLFEKLFSEL